MNVNVRVYTYKYTYTCIHTRVYIHAFMPLLKTCVHTNYCERNAKSIDKQTHIHTSTRMTVCMCVSTYLTTYLPTYLPTLSIIYPSQGGDLYVYVYAYST